MLEKIGLPPKPSLRGNNWVVDASHCQGCPSQFTFINRKHHCRRCGGLFCGKCTQKRMILRGQGDSPVRICEPCKKIEEASRFEMRHGHKGRAGRGVSKVVSQDIIDISQIMLTSSTSLSNAERDDHKSSTDNLGDLRVVSGPISLEGKLSTEVTPEELRSLASMEKGKYKVLKGEGKSGEAIKAFKKAKEAEKQANALELLRKRNNRKVAKDTCHSTDSGKVKADFADELRQLGWSDAADVLPGDRKLGIVSHEGELSSLLGEISAAEDGSCSVSMSQVMALKKKALLLKREGKRDEAKEELKKAKILERQLEEQKLLAEPQDSDEEIAALIHTMDSGKDNLPSLSKIEAPLELDVDILYEVDVTEDDLNDPEMSDVLRSLGWEEEAEEPGFFDDLNSQKAVVMDDEKTLQELLRLKKAALVLRREGKGEEAGEELRKCDIIEHKLEEMKGNSYQKSVVVEMEEEEEEVTTEMTKDDLSDPSYLAILSTLGWGDGREAVGIQTELRGGGDDKETDRVQQEIVSLKRKAVALKREGKLEEAKIEMRNVKLLLQAECVDGSSDAEKCVVVSNSNGGGVEEEDDCGTTKVSGHDRFKMQQESLRHKRQALKLRREGRVQEAESELNLAMALEAKLDGSGGGGSSHKLSNRDVVAPSGSGLDGVDELLDPQLLASLKEVGLGESVDGECEKREKMEEMIKTEKMKAVRLKREGKREEALDVFRNAKFLEKKLKDMCFK